MTQDTVLSILKTGANVFITGAPGAGKTHTLNRYIEYLKQCRIPVAITASTGIAATHIGGMTIHAWSGVGIKKTLSSYDLDEMTTREALVKRVKTAKVLVIDEISMLDGQVLDTVDMAIRALRQSKEPFGGLQVILVGDFFQLPPVARYTETARFAFESDAWEKLNILTCYLTEQHRHEDDTLVRILSAIREGSDDEDVFLPLFERLQTSPDVHSTATKLYAHNTAADRVNEQKLAELQKPIKRFSMTGSGNPRLVEALKANCLSPEELLLKEGAVVLATKNNFEAGYVNGTVGTVTSFHAHTGYPIITTHDGRSLTIEPVEWKIEDNGKVRASISQVPLRLAWAITVHKSQGMTLDAAVIDLSHAFEYGQGYVALSRVRSLAGIFLLGINARAFQVHPSIIEKDAEFRSLSSSAEASFASIPPAELETMHRHYIEACGGVVPSATPDAPNSRQKNAGISATSLPSTFDHTLALIRQGKTIPEIATIRSLVWSTIAGHIARLVEQKKLTIADRPQLLVIGNLSEKDVREIDAAFTKLRTAKLTPVFEHFTGTYSFETLHIARAVRSLCE